MFIRKKRKGNRLAFCVVSSLRRGKAVKQRSHLYLGSVPPPVRNLFGGLQNAQDYVDFWLKARQKAFRWHRSSWRWISSEIVYLLESEWDLNLTPGQVLSQGIRRLAMLEMQRRTLERKRRAKSHSVTDDAG